jgi:hypothetical protein
MFLYYRKIVAFDVWCVRLEQDQILTQVDALVECVKTAAGKVVYYGCASSAWVCASVQKLRTSAA